jgi:hypothetical protein
MGLDRPKESPTGNEGVTRRGALQFLGKVAASMAAAKVGLGSIPGAEAAERQKTPEENADELITLMAQMFGKNGAETANTKSEKGLSRNRFNVYIIWMSAISGALKNSYANAKKSSVLEKYLTRSKPPGLMHYKYAKEDQEEILKNAAPGSKSPEVQLNSYLVTRNNKIYEVTARHGAVGAEGFFSIQMGPDVAIREVTKEHKGQNVTDLNQSVDDEDLSGKVGVIIGMDVHGNEIKIHTPFVRATPAILKSIYPNYESDKNTNEAVAALAHTYICVLPPHFGLRNEYKMLGLQGMSGSFSGVIKGERDIAATGPLMAVKEFTGVCATIGFVSTRKAVVDVIDAFEQQKKEKSG